MKKLLLLAVMLFSCAFAQNFDFNSKGEDEANIILKNYIQKEFDIDDFDTCAYFYDIDNDNTKEIIGIVKTNIFYTLEGYKLVVLKKISDNYEIIKSDVFFDNSQNLLIEGDKITYYKTIFYKNKKYSASIKNNEIKTSKNVGDKLTDKKVQNIEQLTRHTHNENVNNLELSDFKSAAQKNINLKYNNLSDRTKHYLEMK